MSTAMSDALRQAGEVELPRFTTEELTAIGAEDVSIVQRQGLPEWLGQWPDEARTAILATALRAVVARGLVRSPTPAELAAARESGRLDIEPLGDLRLILSARRAPDYVVLVLRETYVGALYGFTGPDGGPALVHEEVTPEGFHSFRLRTPENAVEALAQVADPDAGARADGPELGEPEPGSPAQIAASVTGLGPGLTRFEAVHQREAGDRRTQLTVEEVDAGVRVLTATFGVAPRPAAAREASAAGLRRCLQALLNDADDVFA
ncbi:MAG: hypothetical protein E6J41_13685 [Chloroflexi bacterium]|nr:MAG: hypothetical protein E6J41_13685 [Chloroflexota bacterium]